MTGQELYNGLLHGGVFDEHKPPFSALEHDERDKLERAAAFLTPDLLTEFAEDCAAMPDDGTATRTFLKATAANALGRSYPAPVENPVDPPTVEGTSITKDVR